MKISVDLNASTTLKVYLKTGQLLYDCSHIGQPVLDRLGSWEISKLGISLGKEKPAPSSSRLQMLW